MRKDKMIMGYEIKNDKIIIKYDDGFNFSYKIDENSLNYMQDELTSLIKLNRIVGKGATLFSHGYLTLIFTIIAILTVSIMKGITLSAGGFLGLLMSSVFISAILSMVGIQTDNMRRDLILKQDSLIKELSEIENNIRKMEKDNSKKIENDKIMIKPMKHEISDNKEYVKTKKMKK